MDAAVSAQLRDTDVLVATYPKTGEYTFVKTVNWRNHVYRIKNCALLSIVIAHKRSCRKVMLFCHCFASIMIVKCL